MNGCFGEAFTNLPDKGAVAYIGNTTRTYLNVNWRVATGSNDPFAPVSPDEMGLFDAIMHPGYQYIGKVVNELQKAVEGATGANEDLKTRHIYSLTLLGDPSLNICLGTPQPLAVSYQYYNGPGLLFIINSQPGAYFALTDINGDLISADYIDESGSGIAMIDDFDADYFQITITAKNSIPWFEEVNITPITDDLLPAVTCISYPNPFAQYTSIRLNGQARSECYAKDFSIYNLKGEKVREFILSDTNPQFDWYGDDNNGQNLSSGIYLLKGSDASQKIISKLILVK